MSKNDPAERTVRDIRRKTRKQYTAEEKIRIVVSGLRGKASIVCLECGKVGKMLKRHLSTAHGLSVIDYRERWGLPADYPMVSPNYAAQRSELAKKIGLGRKPRKRGRKKG